jgi:hypothetical protein
MTQEPSYKPNIQTTNAPPQKPEQNPSANPLASLDIEIANNVEKKNVK